MISMDGYRVSYRDGECEDAVGVKEQKEPNVIRVYSIASDGTLKIREASRWSFKFKNNRHFLAEEDAKEMRGKKSIHEWVDDWVDTWFDDLLERANE